jgi:hypothetical protein
MNTPLIGSRSRRRRGLHDHRRNRVRVPRIGAGGEFLLVGRTVAVRIERGVVHERVQAVADLPAVGQAV